MSSTPAAVLLELENLPDDHTAIPQYINALEIKLAILTLSTGTLAKQLNDQTTIDQTTKLLDTLNDSSLSNKQLLNLATVLATNYKRTQS